MNKSGYYVRLQYPRVKKPTHICKTPGWFDRIFMGAKLGAIWHCMECGQEWIFISQASYDATWEDWEKTNVQSNS